MRKIISTILTLVMVLSLFTSFGVNAEHWAQDAIDYVTENGYWIAPQPIEPDRAATRAETASLFARILISKIPEYNGAYSDVTADNIYGGDITAVSLMGLMVGFEDEFRPNDTLTREELAVILDRASRMVSDEFEDTAYNMEYYKDGDDVSDWAVQSVQNASERVLMKGKGKKLFDPKGTTTLAEVATVIKSLADISDAEKAKSQTTVTVRDISSSDNIKKDYDVLQTGGTRDQLGIAGFGMLVRFDQAPGNIYIARKTSTKNMQYTMAPPVVMCKVVGPDGTTIARVNMYYKDEGTMEKIINIPDGEPGIYRIQFTSGMTFDMCTIGVQNPTSWGVFGEDSFQYTETTPKEGYIYIPKKHSILSIGCDGDQGKVSVYNAAGTARVGETAVSNGHEYFVRTDISGLKPDTVYMIKVADNFRGGVGFLGTSKVICPTEEMARDLQGGFIYHKDEYAELQLWNPLAVRARERMVEIYNEMDGDFTVEVTKPELPETLDNVRAESLQFAHYFHTITNVKPTLYRFCLDPTTQFFGWYLDAAMVDGDVELPAMGWEEAEYRPYAHDKMSLCHKELVGALTMNSELNAYYANPVLLKRIELQYLAWAVAMNESGVYGNNTPKGNGFNRYYHGTETFTLGEHDALVHGYRTVRNWLSPETRAITDEAMLGFTEVGMCARGQGVTNQMLMGLNAALETYIWSGEEYFLDHYERNAVNCVYPSSQPNLIGQTSPLGYWEESGGSDGGSYGRMGEGMWDLMVMEYLTLPEEKQDPYVVAKIKEGTERFLLFDSLFYTPDINGFSARRTAAFTTRVDSEYGGESAIPGNAYLRAFFPRAKKNNYISIAGANDPDTYYTTAARTAAFIQTSDVGSYDHIKWFWDDYDVSPTITDANRNRYPAGSSWRMYKALHIPQQFDNSEMPTLPFEMLGDYNVYDPDGGAIGIKHKGIYMLIFYDNDLNNQSGYSWLSSGPAQIWDEYFSTIASAQKPAIDLARNSGTYARTDSTNNDYRNLLSGEGELFHTGVMGTDLGGQLFTEGKEMDKVFTWIEKGKSFEITGINPFGGRKITWRYYMTDEGIEIEAGLDSVVEGEDLWVQLPLIDISYSVSDASLKHEGNKAVFAHNDVSTTISWDESVESRLVNKQDESSYYRFLQLKLTPQNPMVKFKFTRDAGSYVFSMPTIEG